MQMMQVREARGYCACSPGKFILFNVNPIQVISSSNLMYIEVIYEMYMLSKCSLFIDQVITKWDEGREVVAGEDVTIRFLKICEI